MHQSIGFARFTRRQFLAGQAAALFWLATGWRWRRAAAGSSIPDSDILSAHSSGLIQSADLRHLYPASEAGREYVRSAPVADLTTAIERVRTRYPKLRRWLEQREALIGTAIQEPEIVFRQLLYRRKVQHWREMYAIQDPLSRDRYLAVTLSLASLPGERASTHHKIVRIFPAKPSYFWMRDASGGWVLKDRWMSTST
jgi:hypothetical protein